IAQQRPAEAQAQGPLGSHAAPGDKLRKAPFFCPQHLAAASGRSQSELQMTEKGVELTLHRLEEAVLGVEDKCRRRGGPTSATRLSTSCSGVESSIRNGIRDVKWSLEDLEETLKLMSQNNGRFVTSEDLAARRKFLEEARKTLADVEFEVSSPSLDAVISGKLQQQQEVAEAPADTSSAEPEQVSLAQGRLRRAGGVQQNRPSQQRKPVDTMVSVNLDTVRDLVEPPRGHRAFGAAARWLSRYRCWLLLLLLVAFFLLLVLMKALSRRASVDGLASTESPATTTECPIDSFDC
uniref:Syntaxin-6_N domain-containing protein n=1 Tax=Macrostomum lignano TaxID=282301 RepID=A0A1I8FAE4_9PLAT